MGQRLLSGRYSSNCSIMATPPSPHMPLITELMDSRKDNSRTRNIFTWQKGFARTCPLMNSFTVSANWHSTNTLIRDEGVIHCINIVDPGATLPKYTQEYRISFTETERVFIVMFIRVTLCSFLYIY